MRQPKSQILAPIFLLFTLFSGMAESFGQTNSSLPKSQTEVISLLQQTAGLIQNGKFTEAETVIRRAVTIAPNNADAHNLLGVVLDQKGSTAEAERAYRQALKINPKGVSPLANLGVLLAKSKREPEAIQIFEKVLQIKPDHPQATINLGFLYNATGNYKKAAAVLETANRFQPGDFDILYNLGTAFAQLKNFDQANKYLSSAAEINPNKAEVFYWLGVISFNQNDIAAEKYFEKSLSLKPDYAAASFMAGEVLAKQKRFSEAVKYYQTALENDSTQAVYHIRLGGTFLFLSEIDNAYKIFAAASSKFQNVAEIHYLFAIAARAKGDLDLSLQLLKKTLSLKPDYVEAIALTGALLLDRNELDEAEFFFRQAVKINANQFNANHDLGRLLVKKQNFSEALPFLKRAGDIIPENAEVHYQLYLVYLRLKQPENADRELALYKKLSKKPF
jgi:tetratricopeptide (TPR) repeat protein